MAPIHKTNFSRDAAHWNNSQFYWFQFQVRFLSPAQHFLSQTGAGALVHACVSSRLESHCQKVLRLSSCSRMLLSRAASGEHLRPGLVSVKSRRLLTPEALHALASWFPGFWGESAPPCFHCTSLRWPGSAEAMTAVQQHHPAAGGVPASSALRARTPPAAPRSSAGSGWTRPDAESPLASAPHTSPHSRSGASTR